MHYRALHAASALLVISLAFTPAARAQGAWTVPQASDRLTLAGDVGVFAQEQFQSSLRVTTLRVDGAYALDSQLVLEGRMGMVMLTSSPLLGESDTVARPGNPTLLFGLRGGGHELRYRIAAGGAAPLAVVDTDEQGRLQRAAYNHAAALQGLFDLSLWAHSHGSLIASGWLDVHVLDQSWLTLEFEPSVLIPARTLYLDQSVEVLFPLGLTFGTRGTPVELGARVQTVATAFSSSDAFALSLGPWVRLRFSHAFAQASYLGNVFEPLAGARGPGIWALHFAAGGTAW